MDLLASVNGMNLVQWVYNKVFTPKELYEILNSKCGMSVQNEMVQILKIAMSCICYMPVSCTSMREVVKLLLGMACKCGVQAEGKI